MSKEKTEKYFDSLLNSKNLVVNYDELLDVYQSDPWPEKFVADTLTFAAYEFSKRTTKVEHVERALTYMKTLAAHVLICNLAEADCGQLLDDHSKVVDTLKPKYTLFVS